MFLDILQNSQKNTCARVSFLIKLQALACNFNKKETLAQVFSCEFSKISKNFFSYRTPLVGDSERVIWFSDKGLKERRKERSKSMAETVLQYPTLMLSSRKDHLSMFQIISMNASLDYLVDAFLRSWVFQIVSESALSFFTALRSSCSWIFWNSQKILKKNSVVKSKFIIVAKRRI